MDRAIAESSYAGDRLAVLKIALFMLIALAEFLLNFIIGGRYCRQNESQNSKRPNASQDGMAIKTATCAQSSRHPHTRIALDPEIHGSVSIEPWVRYYAGQACPRRRAPGVLEREGQMIPNVFASWQQLVCPLPMVVK